MSGRVDLNQTAHSFKAQEYTNSLFSAINSAEVFSVPAERNEGFLILNSRGVILQVSDGAAHCFGLKVSEMEGREFGLPLGGPHLGEIEPRIPNQAGQNVLEMWVVAYMGPLARNDELDDRPAYVVTLRDITTRMKNEQERGLLYTAVGAAANGIMITDHRGGIIWANEAFSRLTGYTLEEIRGQNPRIIKSGMHDDTFYKLMWQTVLGGKIWRGSLINRRKDGSLYTEEMTVTPVRAKENGELYFIAVKEDGTERRQAEERLKRTEERFRLLNEQAVEWIFWRDPDERFSYISPACERISGYTPREFQEHPKLMDEIIVDKDQPLWEKHRKERKDRNFSNFTQSLELRIRHKNGSLRWLSHTCSPVYSNRGSYLGIRGIYVDVTERKAAEERMALADRVFASTMEGVMITDADLRITYVNEAFTRITGYSAAKALGKTPKILQSNRHDEEFYRVMWQILRKEGGCWQGEIWNRRHNGEIYPEWLNISCLRDEVGNITHYAAVFSDLTLQKIDEENIRFLAYHDALTRLPNRFLFQERVERALTHITRTYQKAAVLFLDLDNFKRINDTLGHDAGDELLIQAGKRMQACLRSEDTVARLGGDEYGILLPEISGPDDAGAVAVKVLLALKQPFFLQHKEFNISTSIGVAIAPVDGIDKENLLKHADQAMYRAKDLGRANYQFYNVEMDGNLSKLLSLERGLRQALERGEFSLHFQPLVNVSNKEIVGLEALLRWQSPDFGNVPPAQFIPVAESSGLIKAIGDWVLLKACRQGAEWRKKGYQSMRIAVNVSVHQFLEPGFAERVRDILLETDFEAEYLELEITEGVAMENVELSEIVLQKLHCLGVKIAIDDFGTGYSSLNYLKRFPISTLKIDQSFIQDNLDNSQNSVIVNSILVLARSLNYKAVAEGVETLEQLQFLEECFCDEIQGYLFSIPLPPEKVEILFKLKR